MSITLEELLATGAHFGHGTSRWHPNYQRYILIEKNGIHIINLDETLKAIQKAGDYLGGIAKNGGEVLFVGTKKNAKDIVQQEADKCGMFYVVKRWLGGTLTNFSTVRKSIKKLQSLEKESAGLLENATKKEILSHEREMIRLQDLHRGIKDMKRLPDALIIVDIKHEITALSEARKLNIPVVAIVDTNCDPDLIEHPIPANDDSIRSIKLIISELSRSICKARGLEYTEDTVLEGEEIIDSILVGEESLSPEGASDRISEGETTVQSYIGAGAKETTGD